MNSPEYKEFVASLNATEARYLIVGAHAFAFHARPRATKDLDIWVDPAPDNTESVLAAIREFFGGYDFGLSESDLREPGKIVQLGISPSRIDLLTTVAGLSDFEAAWQARVTATYGGVSAHYVSRDDLVRAKKAADRPQDRTDLEVLEAGEMEWE